MQERLELGATWLAAAIVLATTPYLSDAGFLRIFAVLAAILAVFFWETIACRVSTFVLILVLSHMIPP